MSLRTINITIPGDEVLHDIISTFTPEENLLMLKIGSNCLKEGRNAVAGLTQKEIYNKIKDETKGEIQKLELDLLVEKGLQSRLSEETSKMYKKQIEQMEQQLAMLRKQIQIYESDNKEFVRSEVEKERKNCEFMLQEKDKQVSKFSDTYEKLLVQSHKSTSHKGSDGEKQFEDYANTFIDFKGFELIDKHTQGGSGDFHMRFEEFDVLVDAKNYKKKVPVDQREKIKNDLIKNEHIPFAWLVSLNTSIDKYDKSPVMYEWINTKQCIVYINNLSQNDDPKKILRIVWFTCKELYRFVADVSNDDDELTNMKETQFKLMDKVKNLRKGIREINTTINVTKNMIQVMDDQLKEILESETSTIVESNYSLFDDWWLKNIELTDEDIRLLSTDLWFKFKSDNKGELSDFNITPDKFKQFVKSKTPDIVLKNKNANSAFEIKGIKFKSTEEKIAAPVLEVVLVDDNKKKKKIIKKSKVETEVYFDKTIDKTIIEDYIISKDDVMTLASKYNVKTFQLVSLLVRYNIIAQRSDSRGYDKYKETEEYKNKIVEPN